MMNEAHGLNGVNVFLCEPEYPKGDGPMDQALQLVIEMNQTKCLNQG